MFLITYPPFIVPFAWLWPIFLNYLFIIISIISFAFILLGSFLIVIEGLIVEPYRRPKQVIVIGTCMVLIGFAFTPIGWQFFTGIFLLTYYLSGSILALALITLAENFWYIISGMFYGMVQIILGLLVFKKAVRDYYQAA